MIRQAVPNDIDAIMDVIQETIVIMSQEENPQWDNEYPQRSHFMEDIRSGTLYVYEEAEEIAGLICVNDIEPPEYAQIAWRFPQENALVVHRMAVSPSHRKRGIGAALLGFADELAAKGQIHCIKTDTFSRNRNMNRLFESCGYEKVGEMSFRRLKDPFFCYDKQLS